jgi:hypothetical protein
MTAKLYNFRDRKMFMNVVLVKNGKKTVAACFKAPSRHVPDITEEIHDRNQKYGH